MPFSVDQLISEHQRLITVAPDQPASDALNLMLEHDFDQLPVISSDNRLLGMVTSYSILRAIKNFKITLDGALVKHATVAAKKHYSDNDLFDLLDDLSNEYAVVIVDKQDKAVGIVTSYDTTDFFRRRAEDMMYVEDIESALKEYINSAYTSSVDVLDEQGRSSTIDAVTGSRSKDFAKFKKGLGKYSQSILPECSFDNIKATQAFDEVFPKLSPKEFERLTMSEFVSILLHDDTWQKSQSYFGLEKDAIRSLLEDICNTRNALAHFRGEITAAQRDQLRFCADLLNRQRPSSTVAIKTETILQDGNVDFQPVSSVSQSVSNSSDASSHDQNEIIPLEESSSAGRYIALAQHLQQLKEDTVQFSFSDIETIIGGPLPEYSRKHRSWWANDSVSHIQSQQWLDAGWRVNGISITDQRVKFVRSRERDQQYIAFFSSVIAQLHTAEGFPLKAPSPTGQNWQVVASLPRNETQKAVFTLSFAHKGRLRADLYIDTWSYDSNKNIFDMLTSNAKTIESEIGTTLSWERLDDRRACRIAVYHEGSIKDDQSRLERLCEWAVGIIQKLYQSLADRTENAIATNAERQTEVMQ